MRRRDRPTTWGLRGSFTPVIPRDLRLEVDERMLADGSVREPVNPAQVRQQVQTLLQQGCEACCLFFINGYANAVNEQSAAAIVRELWPNDYVSVATEIVPEIREFERASTAALNASLQPPVSGYLDQLESALQRRGFGGELLIVQSNGGVMDVATARKLPVRTALSGPAAGVIAAQGIAAAVDMNNIVTCDMGGTSFDVALVADGKTNQTAQASIGFGRVVRTPMIEITTIGAGGGSIAAVDKAGILNVGPESAGSDPGPVCYGLGNTRPTVTDANLVLGRINADRPIGGKEASGSNHQGGISRLDTTAARNAIDQHIAAPLGIATEAAADAILRVANAQMAGAIRLVSIERGHDPSRFVAMPFGGGGALHTGALIKDVGLEAAIVPRYPGITSALGCVIADMRHDRVQTVNRLLADCDFAMLGQQMHAVAEALTTAIKASNINLDAIERRVELDMLYLGQTHAVAVPLDVSLDEVLEAESSELISAALVQDSFDIAYEREYGRLLEGIPLRVINFRVSVIGRRPRFDMQVLASAEAAGVQDRSRDEPGPSEVPEWRDVWVDGQTLAAPVLQRGALAHGQQIDGPALVEQPDTTVFIDPGLRATVDSHANLVIRRAESA